MKKIIALALSLAFSLILLLTGCSSEQNKTETSAEAGKRIVTDIYGRQIEIPEKVESIAAIGAAARFITYAGCADKLIGVTDLDKKSSVQMPYTIINKDRFAGLPSVGAGGANDTTYTEELVSLAPDVIIAMVADKTTVDDVQSKTGIPVVAIYADGIFNDSVYNSITIIGDVMGTQERCNTVVQYIKDCYADLQNRTKDIPDNEKLTVYTGSVNFRGVHGFDGTYGKYPPFDAIGAKNVVDETGQAGALIIDKEKVIAWDPDIIFLTPNAANMKLVNDDYKANKDFYENLKAVKNGQVYSQIAYNYNWTNIEIAIADTYYAGKIIYPDAFKDIDPVVKADEIFKAMLGQTFYKQLADDGNFFGKLTIGK